MPTSDKLNTDASADGPLNGLSAGLLEWSESGDFVEVAPLNRRVFYRQFGNAQASSRRTLLLLHGFPESSFSYHKVIHGMLQTFDRVVVFDMLGYGFSDKPRAYSYSLVPQADIALQVWQMLGVTGGHILSHDMGTSVLTEITARFVNEQLPAWFSGGLQSLTFTNGSMVLRLAKLRMMQKLLLSPMGRGISALANYSLFRKTVLSAHGVGLGVEHGLSEQDIESLWQSCLLQDGHHKNHLLIRYLNDRRRFESTRWLPALRFAARIRPVHFCWGSADQVARIEMARYLHRDVCPSSTLSEMDGAGHFCQLGSAAVWVDSVARFYQDVV